jgi:hypothetical protein
VKSIFLLFGALALAAPAVPPSLEIGSVSAAAARLQPGEYLWAPQVAPSGPVLLVVSLSTQRAVIYRNGIPIGISTVSTGRPGYQTPTGVFSVLQRHVEHYSSKYDDAPMPFMQRLTWGGIALHGGNLPGYPASHGCIRLPTAFAQRLYRVTRLGMTVVITDQTAVPHIAPAEVLLNGATNGGPDTSSESWRPELAPDGPVSIVISSSDRRMVVLRNGIVIARAPVTIDGQITATSAYMLGNAPERRNWVRITLPGQAGDAAASLRGRIHVRDEVRRNVEAILRPGTTVVVTPDSLSSAQAGRQMTIVESKASE